MNNKKKNIVTTIVFVALIAFFTVSCIISAFNPKAYSSIEKRPMAQFPTDFTIGELLNNKPTVDPITGNVTEPPIAKFEDFTVDQFPYRQFFRYIKAHFAMDLLGLRENNGYIVENGYIGQITTSFEEKSLDYSIGRLKMIYETFLKDNGGNKYLCIIPDKSYHFAKEYGYPSADYDALLGKVKNALPDMKYIDIFDTLTLSDYYKTDWHWNQVNILDTLEVIGKEIGFHDRLSYKYDEVVMGDYRGGYYDSSALYPTPEKLSYLTNKVLKSCTVLEGGKSYGLYNPELFESYVQYDFFLSEGNGGWRSIQKIDNPQAKTDDEIIIFRDSFGSAIVPLIAEAYKTVYVVDIRSVPPVLLGANLDFEGKDVLFLFSTTVLNTRDFK